MIFASYILESDNGIAELFIVMSQSDIVDIQNVESLVNLW